MPAHARSSRFRFPAVLAAVLALAVGLFVGRAWGAGGTQTASAPEVVDHSQHAVAIQSAEPSPSPSATPLAVDHEACRSALESLRAGLGEVMEVLVQVRRHAGVQDRLNSGMLDAEQARREWDDSQAAALATLERADATHSAFHAAAKDCPVMPEAGEAGGLHHHEAAAAPAAVMYTGEAMCVEALSVGYAGIHKVIDIGEHIRAHAAVHDQRDAELVTAEQARQQWAQTEDNALAVLIEVSHAHGAFLAADARCPVSPVATGR